MSEVKVGQRVRVKRHLDVDAVPFGPGTYEVVKNEDAKRGEMTAEIAKRVTSKQGNAEVVETKGKGANNG